MIELWLIPIIGLLGLISSIISSKGSLFDKRYKWYKRLTQRGQIIALIGIAIVGMSIWQYIVVKKRDDQKEKIQLAQRKLSDSTISTEIKKGIDSNRHQLFTDLSEALAKENLKLDTLTKQIESLRDSAKTVILTLPREKPIIIIKHDGIKHKWLKNDSLEIELTFISSQAPSNLINLNVFCEVNYVNKTKQIIPFPNFISKVNVPKDQPMAQTFTINFIKSPIEHLNIALTGNYSQVGLKSSIKLEDVYVYFLATKETGFLQGEDKILFLNKYHLK
jgi:hypothetical protein